MIPRCYREGSTPEIRDQIGHLTDVLAVGSALASQSPDARPEEMLFLGMPAARRMKLDADRCALALRDSHAEIVSLRQALGS